MRHILGISFGAALICVLASACGGPQRPARPDLRPPEYERAPVPEWQEGPGEPVDLGDDEAFEDDPEFDSPPSQEPAPTPAPQTPKPEPEAAPAEPEPVNDPLAPVAPPDAPIPGQESAQPLPIEPPKPDPLQVDSP